MLKRHNRQTEHNTHERRQKHTDTTRIKKCPHCGGTGILQSTWSYKIRKYFISVKCDICGATGKPYLSDAAPAEQEWNTPECDQAVDAWNMRYQEENE